MKIIAGGVIGEPMHYLWQKKAVALESCLSLKIVLPRSLQWDRFGRQNWTNGRDFPAPSEKAVSASHREYSDRCQSVGREPATAERVGRTCCQVLSLHVTTGVAQNLRSLWRSRGILGVVEVSCVFILA